MAVVFESFTNAALLLVIVGAASLLYIMNNYVDDMITTKGCVEEIANLYKCVEKAYSLGKECNTTGAFDLEIKDNLIMCRDIAFLSSREIEDTKIVSNALSCEKEGEKVVCKTGG